MHPITWPEPFGLTMIEAMACGCPVIAFDKGSVSEIIVHGKTGFVVENVDQMATAILTIETIKRQECREYALKTFNSKRMVDGYEKIYRALFPKRARKGENGIRSPYSSVNTPQ